MTRTRRQQQTQKLQLEMYIAYAHHAIHGGLVPPLARDRIQLKLTTKGEGQLMICDLSPLPPHWEKLYRNPLTDKRPLYSDRWINPMKGENLRACLPPRNEKSSIVFQAAVLCELGEGSFSLTEQHDSQQQRVVEAEDSVITAEEALEIAVEYGSMRVEEAAKETLKQANQQAELTRQALQEHTSAQLKWFSEDEAWRDSFGFAFSASLKYLKPGLKFGWDNMGDWVFSEEYDPAAPIGPQLTQPGDILLELHDGSNELHTADHIWLRACTESLQLESIYVRPAILRSIRCTSLWEFTCTSRSRWSDVSSETWYTN